MKKNNKNMWIILAVALIVANPQITTLSYALESNTNQATLEKNIEENVPQTSEDTKSEEVVTNKTELISALKNENTKNPISNAFCSLFHSLFNTSCFIY